MYVTNERKNTSDMPAELCFNKRAFRFAVHRTINYLDITLMGNSFNVTNDI